MLDTCTRDPSIIRRLWLDPVWGRLWLLVRMAEVVMGQSKIVFAYTALSILSVQLELAIVIKLLNIQASYACKWLWLKGMWPAVELHDEKRPVNVFGQPNSHDQRTSRTRSTSVIADQSRKTQVMGHTSVCRSAQTGLVDNGSETLLDWSSIEPSSSGSKTKYKEKFSICSSRFQSVT